MGRRGGSEDIGEALENVRGVIGDTFGGVVFVTLLVFVLVGLIGTSAARDENPQMAERDMEKRLIEAQGEIGRLEDIIRNQEARIAALGPAPDDAIVQRYMTLSVKERDVRRKQDELKIELGKLEDNLREAEKRLDELLDRERPLAEEDAKADRDLRSIRLPDTQKVRNVMFVPTEKTQVALLLSGKRLAFIYKYDAQGNVVGDNDDDVEVERSEKDTPQGKKNTTDCWRQKEGRGILVENAGSFKEDFIRQLQKMGLTSVRHYLVIAVWPDSYSEFEVVRDLLIEKGWKYNVIIVKGGEPVRAGGEGGTQ